MARANALRCWILLTSILISLLAESRLIVTPSNARIVILPEASTKRLSLELIVQTHQLKDYPHLCSLVHLFEHLWVKGLQHDLDWKLESNGLYLSARTLRDHFRVSIEGDPSSIDVALVAVKELLKRPNFTTAEIKKEIPILMQELALVGNQSQLCDSVWKKVHGQTVSPYGDLQSFISAQPNDFIQIHQTAVRFENLSLSISAPIQESNMFKKIQANLPEFWIKNNVTSRSFKKTLAASDQLIRIENKSILAIPVCSVSEENTLLKLASALSLASSSKEVKMTYSPGVHEGLIILETSSLNGFSKIGSSLLGRQAALLKSWIKSRVSIPEEATYFTALLASCENPCFIVELAKRANAINAKAVAHKLSLWSKLSPQLHGFPGTSSIERVLNITLTSMPFNKQDENLHEKCLAWFALGVGKESAFYRVLREQLGISYDQKLTLNERQNIIYPKLVYSVFPKNLTPGNQAFIKHELIKDVDNWSAKHINRACALLNTMITYGSTVNPFSRMPSYLNSSKANLSRLEQIKDYAKQAMNKLVIQ